MLQFWKKSGQQKEKTDTVKLSPECDVNSPSLISNGGGVFIEEPGLAGPLSDFQDEVVNVFGNVEDNDDSQVIKGKSRLWMTLSQVLEDEKGCLIHFKKFMESRPTGNNLLSFWLDVNNFHRMAPTSEEVTRSSLNISSTAAFSDNATLNPDGDNTANSLGSPSSVLSVQSLHSSASFPLVGMRSQEISKVVLDTDGQQVVEGENVTNNSSPCEGSRESGDEHLQSSKRVSVSLSYLEKSGDCNKNRTGGQVSEAVRIFRCYVAQDAPMQVGLSMEVRNAIVDAICRPGGGVDQHCFVEAQQQVFSIMENQYFNDFLSSEYHCKHQVDILTSGNVLLDDILYCETALFHFMEFLEQEGKQGLLLEFWLAANNFQQHLLEQNGSYNPLEAQDDAIILYDKYFSLQATHPLGLGASVRLEVEQNICREEGPLPSCFQKPMAIVHRALERRHLSPFLSSQLFYQLLSELVNSKRHSMKASTPDSGKEGKFGVPLQNTLLATRDQLSIPRTEAEAPLGMHMNLPAKKVVRNVDGRNMTIDSKQLYDPDSLWKRRQKSGLRFGRINEMGRFETDIEPEPDRKGESRISKVVKKLVNMDEDKAKEDMAWQIAEMIVKDITSLTLGGCDEDIPLHDSSDVKKESKPVEDKESLDKGVKS